MYTILVTTKLWGIYRKEWQVVAKKTKYTVKDRILVILLFVVLVGIGSFI